MDDLVRVRSHLPGQLSSNFHGLAMSPSRPLRSPLAGTSRLSRVRQSSVKQSRGRLTWGQTPVGKLHVQLPVRRAQKKSCSNLSNGSLGSDSDTCSAAAVVPDGQSKTQALLQTGARRFSLTSSAKGDLIPLAVSNDAEPHAYQLSSAKESCPATVR
jgi:hypothetical protein